MHTLKFSAIAALMIYTGLPAWTQDLASVRKALEAKYALTVTTADKTDIVKPGDVLVLKKSNLVTVDVKSRNVYQNKYVNGRITQNALGVTNIWLKRLPGSTAGGSDRTFVAGEKVWLTGIDVREKSVVVNLFTDAYSDTRYEASLTFPFEKGSTPTASQVLEEVAEVFDIQPSDDKAAAASGGNNGAPNGQTAQNSPPPPAPAAQAVEAPPPPIAPPPPPPADPKTIAIGQTPDQVTANFGQPEKKIVLGSKQIFVYKDMKVTFLGGKVSDVQ